ncbi:NACHT domain-containing protein [Streptomyces sp. NPDC050636]|uniref:NACHT domain-containing protein n=1 Tax=Streptomyces sp. NPDC050636 TaxID=3154510 RepID=UPI003428D120
MRSRGLKWLGAILYLALLLGAVVYILNHGLDTADKTSSVVGGLLALPPAVAALWQLWRRPRTTLSLEEVAGQLAVAVKNQWDAEAALRRVNDPYPLPVAWRAADGDLAEPWPLLAELARAWPGGPPGDPVRWPQQAAGLADEGARIGEVFTDRVPTLRLVVLGEPGAGKSVLLMRLVQDLLARRTGDEPVPVLFSLASWNPDQPLKTWLADQLRRAHPSLCTPAPATTTADTPDDQAQALLETNRILPLLDGFDELPPDLHHRALHALNRSLPDGQPLVLASRAAPYRAALSGAGPTVRLNGAAAIQLLPLDPDRATAYLRRDAGGLETSAAARWHAVAAELGTASPVGQALSTPLGLFLARTIYNPRPGPAPTAEAPHPDELCDTEVFPERAAVDRHLFNAFIPAAYAPDAPLPPSWNAAQAHRAFVTLARFLERQHHGSPDLAWWELVQAIPASRYLTKGLASGLVVGITGWLTGWLMDSFAAAVTLWVAGALMVGLGGWLAGGRGMASATPSTGLRWSPFGLAVGLTVGITAALAYVLFIALMNTTRSRTS